MCPTIVATGSSISFLLVGTASLASVHGKFLSVHLPCSVLLAALSSSLASPFQQLPAVHAAFLAEAALLAVNPGDPMFPVVHKHVAKRGMLDVQVRCMVHAGASQLHAQPRKPWGRLLCRWCASALVPGARWQVPGDHLP
jgi:hypothetical protein